MTRCPKCRTRAVLLVYEGQGRGVATFGCCHCGRIWRERYPRREHIEAGMRLAVAEAKASLRERK